MTFSDYRAAFGLLCDFGHAGLIVEEPFLENGRSAHHIEVKVNGVRLVGYGRLDGAIAPAAFQHPLRTWHGLIGVVEELEHRPKAVIAGEDLIRGCPQDEAHSAAARPRELLRSAIRLYRRLLAVDGDSDA